MPDLPLFYAIPFVVLAYAFWVAFVLCAIVGAWITILEIREWWKR
jgi:hypothetical protein